MKKARCSFLPTAAAILLLTACSSDENTTAGTQENYAARFSATIAGQASTRAYDQTWENGDDIGISGTTGGKAYTNVRYVTTGNGDFTVATAGSEIYYQDDNAVTFTAYYPWNDLGEAATVSADTREQSLQKDFDFLWSRQTGSKASPNVRFNFAHKMVKFVLTVQRGADVSYDEVKAAILSLSGFKNNGTFSVTDGTATATGDNLTGYTFAGNTEATLNAPFVTDDAAETVAYTFILFPQAFDAALPIEATLIGMQTFRATLDFTAANAQAGDANAANEWVAGRQYNISMTLNKTGITVDGCTIKAWNEADGGSVSAS